MGEHRTNQGVAGTILERGENSRGKREIVNKEITSKETKHLKNFLPYVRSALNLKY